MSFAERSGKRRDSSSGEVGADGAVHAVRLTAAECKIRGKGEMVDGICKGHRLVGREAGPCNHATVAPDVSRVFAGPIRSRSQS